MDIHALDVRRPSEGGFPGRFVLQNTWPNRPCYFKRDPLTLLTSSEVLPCAHRADMSLDIFQRSELARVRSPPLFEQDKDRGKLQGVRVKENTNWKTSCKLHLCKQEEKST